MRKEKNQKEMLNINFLLTQKIKKEESLPQEIDRKKFGEPFGSTHTVDYDGIKIIPR